MRLLKNKLLLISLISALNTFIYSQNDNYYIRNFNLKEGLYNNHVRSITKDSCGFLWIATWDGLSRFDGYEFENYFKNTDDTLSLPDIDLKKVCVDRFNNVWLLVKTFLCRYDRLSNTFIRYSSSSSKYKTKSSNFSWICIDSKGNLWVSGNKGIESYTDNSHFILHELQNIEGKRINADTLWTFVFDEQNNLWVFDKYKLIQCKYVDSKNNFKIGIAFNYDFPRIPFSNFIPQIYQIRENIKKDKIWISSNIGLYCINIKTSIISRVFNSIPTGEFCNSEDIIWTSYQEGLIIYSPIKNDYNHLKTDELCIPETYYFDEQKIIWMGGLLKSGEGSGLYMMAKTSSFFKYYLDNTKEKDKLAVICIFKDQFKNVWIGTHNYNYLIKIQPDGLQQKLNFIDNIKFPLAYPRSFLEQPSGDLWIGYYFNFLYRFDFKLNKFYKHFSYLSSHDNIAKMESFQLLMNDKNGNIFTGGGTTYCSFNPLNNSLSFNGKFSKDGFIYALYIDKDSNYWIGSKNQLKFIDKTMHAVTTYGFKNITSNIECIVQGDSSDLWLALLGEGICHFDKKTKSILTYTVKDGLSHNTTYHILKDNHGNLWISTNKGISMFNTKTFKFRNFGIQDGLRIEEFNSEAAFKSNDGELFFGGMGGVVSFFPDSLADEYVNYSLPLLITELKVSGERFAIKNIYEQYQIELTKGTNNFEISFACPDYRNAEKIHYRYCLIGYNDRWIETDYKHRSVNYASLEHGKYEFMVEATDAAGNWSRKKNITIIIPAYYYQEAWFWILIFILVVSVTTIIIVLRIRNMRLIEHRKQEQLKHEILRNQLNPHFIDNCLNSVNNLVSINDELKVNQYLSDFSRLMRLILNNSNMEYIPFKDEIESVQKYLLLEHTNNSDKFEFEIVLDEAIDIEDTEIMPSMTQPYIENAIKHAFPPRINKKGMIKVDFTKQDNYSICCIITDDGIGHKESQHHKQDLQKQKKSKGESLVKERLELYNSLHKTNFKIESGDLFKDRIETGTKVKIEIPIKKKI